MISREMQLAAIEQIERHRERNPDDSCARAYRALYPDHVSLDDFRQAWQHVTGEHPAEGPPEEAVSDQRSAVSQADES